MDEELIIRFDNAKAARGGGTLPALEELRDTLASILDSLANDPEGSGVGILPQYSSQYRGVLAEIEAAKAPAAVPVAEETETPAGVADIRSRRSRGQGKATGTNP